MARQTIVNDDDGGPTAKPNPNGFIDDVGSFGNDLAALVALQAQLAAADARESLARALPAVVGLAVLGLILIAGAVAVVAGFALWLAETTQARPGVVLMLVGLGCLVPSAAFSWFCVRRLGASLAVFRRSAEELERNAAWVKSALTRDGR